LERDDSDAYEDEERNTGLIQPTQENKEYPEGAEKSCAARSSLRSQT
jgi:hypothetical protein